MITKVNLKIYIKKNSGPLNLLCILLQRSQTHKLDSSTTWIGVEFNFNWDRTNQNWDEPDPEKTTSHNQREEQDRMN